MFRWLALCLVLCAGRLRPGGAGDRQVPSADFAPGRTEAFSDGHRPSRGQYPARGGGRRGRPRRGHRPVQRAAGAHRAGRRAQPARWHHSVRRHRRPGRPEGPRPGVAADARGLPDDPDRERRPGRRSEPRKRVALSDPATGLVAFHGGGSPGGFGGEAKEGAGGQETGPDGPRRRLPPLARRRLAPGRQGQGRVRGETLSRIERRRLGGAG